MDSIGFLPMSLESAIESIVSKFSAPDGGYALADEKQTQDMCEFLGDQIRSELEPLFSETKPAPSAVGLVKKTKGGTGFHLFCKQTRTDLGEEKYKELGGHSHVCAQWRDLSDEVRAEWNEKAKSQRTVVMVAASAPKKREPGVWQRFSNAYANWAKEQKAAGQPVEAGAKACAAARKEKTETEQLQFIATYCNLK